MYYMHTFISSQFQQDNDTAGYNNTATITVAMILRSNILLHYGFIPAVYHSARSHRATHYTRILTATILFNNYLFIRVVHLSR